MADARDILKQYWHHDRFRGQQENTINAVLSGRDALVLMPTGGGKSICFQVPALMKEGLALVISPLVSLMKDQVANLQARGIKAMSITGGLSVDQLSDMLDNAQYGQYKFLYLSPERLQAEWVIERIKSLPVNLIAIDEAHCVSQWGHDFRPAYLRLSALKAFFPNVPTIALTASATPKVQYDILSHLGLRQPAVFRQSFARTNLSYRVIEAEDKLYRLSLILKRHRKPAIVYVRNRKSCLDIASDLVAMGFTATYYHGGMPPAEKEKNMQAWMNETAQVIVSTSAFGMGIDKANVQTVTHVHLPENLESYYQETGRAGRDGEDSFAYLILGPGDIAAARSQFLDVLPDRKFLLSVYVRLCNFLQIAYGEGSGETFGLNLGHFCSLYGFPAARAFQALQFLDRQGILTVGAEPAQKVWMQFLVPSKEIVRYISLNPDHGAPLEAIMRTYPGIFDVRTAIDTASIAKKSGVSADKILDVLDKMMRQDIVELHHQQNDTSVTFHEAREDDHTINRVAKYLESQNRNKQEQLHAVVGFVSDKATCLNKKLLAYFGEKTGDKCGRCSNCAKTSNKPTPELSEQIVSLLRERPLDSRQLHDATQQAHEAITGALRILLEEERIAIKPNNQYILL